MVTRRQLLAAFGITLIPGLSSSAEVDQKRHMIIVLCEGGWDPLFVFDPKTEAEVDGPFPDASNIGDDVEQVRQFGSLTINNNLSRRPNVNAFFEEHHENTCILNGLFVGALNHRDAVTRLLTGPFDEGDLLALAANAAPEVSFPALDWSGLARSGPLAHLVSRVGLSGQLRRAVDSRQRGLMGDKSPRPSRLKASSKSAVDRYLRERFHTLNTEHGDLQLSAQAASEGVRPAHLTALPMSGGTGLASQGAVAAQLFEEGLCQAVMLRPEVGFDTHADAYRQHANYDRLFSELSGLVAVLKEQGLFETTTVVVLSEMGRTPFRNAENGTDHWPHTSALYVGGQVRSTVVGSTDSDNLSLPVDPISGGRGSLLVRPENLIAGLLAHLRAPLGPFEAITPLSAPFLS